ncbi:thiol methyltransferase 1-like protein [Lentisphaera araneosa HTCC2155]|uniref:Thiol methyltransferase 1-like protein n=1 Tax=Lentisphaera araneosa HTCC2155 TaxID=313628 RepID=A6DS72_9BACT|nr:class I SAM-dependent methyltransferase [Lentisphaera araneosa]EDM25532.1 thiol methyltransferase 1-like protein [Lentisphaera araneosa HTCC2155]
MRTKGNEKAESWDKIYREGNPGWDIKKPAPPFEDLFKQNPSWLKAGSLISFGCGGGHDANFFAQNDFNVTAVDFASEAVKLARSNYPQLNVIQKNILELSPEYDEQFDYVLEHTCFCAVPLDHRRAYMESAHAILKAGAYLFGLFYRFDPPDQDGPPYSLSLEDLEDAYSGLFTLEENAIPKRSHGRRTQRERFIVLKKI